MQMAVLLDDFEKANVITAIGELIQIADNKAEFPDYDRRHGNKAKNGWYRYDTRFGIPVYSELGEIESLSNKRIVVHLITRFFYVVRIVPTIT